MENKYEIKKERFLGIMKRFIVVFSLVIIALFTTHCRGEESQNDKDVEQNTERIQDVDGKGIPTQEELAAQNEALMASLMTPEDFDLNLNNEEKWKVEPESLKMLMQVKQQLYVISGNMENYTIDSYNMLGSEIHEFVKTIGEIENVEANKEFQKVIKETKNQCVFLMGSDLKHAQLAVINLSILYEEVPKYFGATEN